MFGSIQLHVIRRVASPQSAASFQRLCRSAQRVLRLPSSRSEVVLALVSDRDIQALHKRSRGINRPTDVLSFPLHTSRPYRPDADGVIHLGDIVISVPTARRQARARGCPLGEELDELMVHGLLHLVGYDHERPRDAVRMSRVADRILRSV